MLGEEDGEGAQLQRMVLLRSELREREDVWAAAARWAGERQRAQRGGVAWREDERRLAAPELSQVGGGPRAVGHDDERAPAATRAKRGASP
eukprot:6827334-Prymnesium_polylepis.1